MIRHNLGRFIVSKLSHQLQVSNARARSCYVSLIHHYPIVSIVTFRVDSRHINAGLRVTEVLLRGASTGMYSSIELTHGQFVQDMSAPVEKDTLINCCHVRQPASSFLSFLIFSFPPSFLFLFFFWTTVVATFRLLVGIVLYVRVGVLAFFTRGPHDDVPLSLYFLHLTTSPPRLPALDRPLLTSTFRMDWSSINGVSRVPWILFFLSLSLSVDRKLAVSIHLPRVKPFKLSVTKEGIYMASNIE